MFGCCAAPALGALGCAPAALDALGLPPRLTVRVFFAVFAMSVSVWLAISSGRATPTPSRRSRQFGLAERGLPLGSGKKADQGRTLVHSVPAAAATVVRWLFELLCYAQRTA